MDQTQAIDAKATWKLIVGLGNPGKKYENTYHNLGAMAVREAVGEGKELERPFSIFKNKPFEYLKENGLIFMKPTVFMNESGRSVSSAIKHFDIKPNELVVIHDDADLPLGDYKVEFGRGSAGHNGVASIIEAIGGNNFWRIRIGARPERKTSLIEEAFREKAGDFVLDKMPSEDMRISKQVLTEIKALYFE